MKIPRTDPLADLMKRVAQFNDARAWKQFHAPKNLAMALSIEAAELMEPFRWMTPEQSWSATERGGSARAVVEDELADVLLLALSLANYLNLDPIALARRKLARNERRYPKARARGRADKYTAYAEPVAKKTSRRPAR